MCPVRYIRGREVKTWGKKHAKRSDKQNILPEQQEKMSSTLLGAQAVMYSAAHPPSSNWVTL